MKLDCGSELAKVCQAWIYLYIKAYFVHFHFLPIFYWNFAESSIGTFWKAQDIITILNFSIMDLILRYVPTIQIQ